MDTDSRLDDILDAWQAANASGRDLPAEQMCADCLDLLPEAEKHIAILRRGATLVGRPLSTANALDPAVPTPESFFTAPAGSPANTILPEQLRPYRILDRLGQGGMGVVYRAEDPVLKREVALKVMLPHYAANPRAKARFIREAQAQAAVEHDHIIAIHQVGEDSGVPFIAMPLLKGETLAAALKANSRPPVTEVLRIGREMAEGLAAAHAKGLVHRDIKPGNVWLEGDRRRVKILDFGLARAVTSQSGDNPTNPITASGEMTGTPAYMSPEQTRGKTVDARSDLFSLGVVLYEMACASRPFTGDDLYAVLSAIALDTPRPLAEVEPMMPRALSALAVRLLAKDPASRPETATAVAQELNRIESGLSSKVLTVSLTPGEPPAARRSSRSRWWLATVSGAVLLLGMVAWFMTQNRDKPKPIDRPPSNDDVHISGEQPQGSATPNAPLSTKRDEVLTTFETVRVKGIAVKHYAKVGDTIGEPRGLLGKDSFGAKFGDQVTVEAELSRPAYAYLVAFRPDGVVEPVFPEDPHEPPLLTDRPRYPSKSRGVNYGLTDGTGLWVFAVAVSDRPLPAFAKAFAGKSAGWKKEDTPPRTVWWDDGQWVEGQSPTGVVRGERGAGATVPGKSAVVRATEWLKAGANADTVGAIGFRVDERK